MKVAQRTEPKTAGIVLHSASSYDLLVWLITLGRPHIFRERMLRPARLKPGGRVLVIDFGKPARKRPFLDFLHHRRGHVELKNIIALLTDAALKIGESGDVGMLGLQCVVAKAQRKDDQVRQTTTVSNHDT